MLPKIAFFGTNALAAALIAELQRLDFEIVGLWDQHLKTSSAWCAHFKIPVASDSIEELLKDQEVDLVIVCALPHFHREITTKALAAGKHVICEPPLGLTGSDNAAIMELAVYYPSMTLSTFGMRHLPGVKAAKKALTDNLIGSIQAFEISLHCGPSEIAERMPYDSTCLRELAAGPLFSAAIHLTDLMHHLAGQRVYTVCGTVKRFQKNPPQFKYDQHLTREDFIMWQGILEGDIPCNTVINNNFPGKFELRFTISGEKGSLVLDGDGGLFLETPGREQRDVIVSVDQSNSQSEAPLQRAPLQMGQRFDYRHPELVVKGVAAMCASLKEAFEPLPERRHWSAEQLTGAGTFRDCQYARAVVDAVKRSSETRRWTEVRIPTKALDGGSLSVSLARFTA
ncbi:putative Glucose-fructose oxidoreductase domain-containing protein 1 [Hypsibius exemplaris]|uniref:Glucose-fructose oxidoreductase domain-containing protein 1 n=1 Tax=Hypsibius exemplaris TaxID=2072580 RepID=A0A9X6NGN9_HYPEX|nr:putative Glucose-fructose oxidoreductase domain-containing protein 1 [Hypsibius exemplaris]